MADAPLPKDGAAGSPFTVAIMQPYFIPYAGYFRLLAAADRFVIYDCVQFPRRGWVHRNQLPDGLGIARWLTLPIKSDDRSVLIRDLAFAPDAADLLARRMRAFPILTRGIPAVAPILGDLRNVVGTPVDYIECLLQGVAGYLGLRWDVIRSSSLEIPSKFRGQERIIEIANRLGARRYVNAPGGRGLYDPAAFDAAGIELAFLDDHRGPTTSILGRILSEDRNAITDEIVSGAISRPVRSHSAHLE